MLVHAFLLARRTQPARIDKLCRVSATNFIMGWYSPPPQDVPAPTPSLSHVQNGTNRRHSPRPIGRAYWRVKRHKQPIRDTQWAKRGQTYRRHIHEGPLMRPYGRFLSLTADRSRNYRRRLSLCGKRKFGPYDGPLTLRAPRLAASIVPSRMPRIWSTRTANIASSR